MNQLSFKQNPIIWINIVLIAALYIVHGLDSDDWSVDNITGYATVAGIIIAAVVSRSRVSPYPPPPTKQELEEA